ncbi:nucleotide exchange factor GrpE [Zavarzinia sp. CC-PAN008]|uniref:nucleotide exchange factor GrpE n=1 Tax=Zavarzinia sp. CC-PAN008 TaxID=3243332 RepID=UPI003F742440
MNEQDQTPPPEEKPAEGNGEIRAEAQTPEPAAEAPPAEDASAVLIAELKDRLLRAMAETENVRRRAEREREDQAKYAVTGFARELCQVADNLRRAVEAVPADERREGSTVATLLDGVELTERSLLSAFEKHGIRVVNPLGQRFDSNFHQAMFEVPGTDQPAGTVVQVIQIGYVIHDRLLRPALVGVAQGQPAPRVDTVA